jgi:hypothetical protein
MITVMIEGVWLFKIFNLSFNVSSISNQSFADARSSNIKDYHYLCLWLVRNINKNPINLSFRLVETGVLEEKPLQGKQTHLEVYSSKSINLVVFYFGAKATASAA